MSWISVKDKLPDKNGNYLCFYRFGEYEYQSVLGFAKSLEDRDEFDFAGKKYSGFYDYDSEWGYYEKDYITHWMPLPEPPEGENGMREKLIKLLNETMSKYRYYSWAYADKIADYLIENGVTIPVKCGECKRYEMVEYYHPDGGGIKNVCRLFKRQLQPDCFCSYGEPKESEE